MRTAESAIKQAFILCCDTESGCGYNLNTACKLRYVCFRKTVLSFENFCLMLVFCDMQLCTGQRSSLENVMGFLVCKTGQCSKYQSHPLQHTIIRILCSCTWTSEVSHGVHCFLMKISLIQGVFVLYYACMKVVFSLLW